MDKPIDILEYIRAQQREAYLKSDRANLSDHKFVCFPGEFLIVLRNFLRSLESVLGDDWIYTKDQINSIEHPATLLQPWMLT